jgi:hypothetical protein
MASLGNLCMIPPAWLPPLAPVGGPHDGTIARLYDVFAEDFKRTGCTLHGRPVWWDGLRPGELYEEGFWHLVSRVNKRSGERKFDSRRAERLPWCKPIIAHADDPAVTTWSNCEGKRRIRTRLWLREHDYVVVLERRLMRVGEVMFVVTAFYVEGESTRRDLRKRFAKRLP